MTAARDGIEPDEGAPGWRRGVGLAALTQLLSVMGFSSAVSFLPLYVQTLGVETAARAAVWAGTLSFAQALAVAVCSPIWGAVADRHGAKLMVERAMLGGGIVFLVTSVAWRVEQLLALFVLLGCFTGVNTAIATLVAAIAPRARLGVSIGLCQTAVFVGVATGPLVGGFLADTFSFRAGIRGGAALLLLAGLIVLVGVHEPRRAPVRATGRRRTLSGLSPDATSRPLLLLIALIFVVQFFLQMITPVMPIFVQQLAPASGRIATLVGLVLATGGVAAAVGAIIWGRNADRLGQRRVLTWTIAGGASTTAAQSLVGGIAPLLVLRGLGGFFTGGLSASTNAAIGTMVSPGSRGAAFGVAGSAFSLGNAFGPLLGGLLAASTGPRVVLAVSGLSLSVGWFLVRALARYEPGADAAARGASQGGETPPEPSAR